MKIEQFARELVYPLSELPVVLALVVFSVLFWIAERASVLGIWLAIVTLPAFFRYAILLLEARANGERAPVPRSEDFNLVDNFWALSPALLLGVFIWLEWRIAGETSLVLAAVILLVFLFLYPASMAVLGITRSPLASINPLALWRMVRLCGPDYLWIPAAVVPMWLAIIWLAPMDLPSLLFDFLANYAFLLMFTLTGAVLEAHGAVAEIDIELPVEKTDEALQDELLVERRKVANHAYGFISRDNRAGGFAHIRDWLHREADREAGYRWFFAEMLTWENRRPALFFAQDYLHQLLGWSLHREAVKLITRCLHEDPGWRPAEADRSHVRTLLQENGRDDLLRRMPL